ncbi:MAG: HpcH/HpaI aldolase/citrate lyase family protein [Actinomycetota bacterium]|nr:HpcH/HpaI aldolase/citrate lyase family protein [Actinomycetota bacterium]
MFAAVGEGLREHDRAYPGDPGGRQPVHTVYVPADRFRATTVAAYGAEALRLLDTHAPDDASFPEAFGVPAALASAVRPRVAEKLRREPVEDLRVDFEDGYGVRPDDEEDRDAARAAATVIALMRGAAAPPFLGLRVKSFADGRHERSVRTLDVFLSTLLEGGPQLPGGFVVTFPKVVATEHVAAFVRVLAALEQALGLEPGVLLFEVQVETPESVIDRHGRVALRAIFEAAEGRLAGAHFGVYDYTAALGLPPSEQRLDHPACDFARHVMQVALAGTGVRLSDGSTNVIPAGEDRDQVVRAWQLHAGHVGHSLRHGFHQGWDLHPAQLPSRYATVYGFLLDGMDQTFERLRAWREEVPAPGGVLDEPATVRALLARVRRAVDCGAVTEDEVLGATGLGVDELQTR